MAARRKGKMNFIDEPAKTEPANVIPLKKKEVKVKAGSTPGYFSTLSSNVKGSLEIPLAPCTAIVGRNRAGKTAVLDAMRLALIGAHHIGPNSDLFGLTPDGSPPMALLTGAKSESHFSFPDGRKTPVVRRTGDFKDLNDAKSLLPLVATEELLQLGTAKAREELFRRFGATLSIEVPPVLAEPQQKIWREVLNISTGDVVERLSNAGTLLRQKKLAINAAINSLLDERERLQQSFAAVGAPSDDLLRDLEEKLDRWRQVRAQPAGRPAVSLAALGEKLLAEAQAFKALPAPPTDSELEVAKALLTQRADIPALESAVVEAKKAFEHAQSNVRLFKVLRALRAKLADGRCLACNQSAHDVHHAALVQEAETALAQLEQQAEPQRQALASLEEQLNVKRQLLTADLMRADHEAATARWRHDSGRKAVLVLKEEYERQQALQQSPLQPVTPPAESEEELRKQLTALQDIRGVAVRLGALGAELRKHEALVADVKTVEQVLGETLNRLLVTIKKTAEDAVNAWMPEGFKAVLALEDGVCRWEVIGSDGRPHPRGAMSGAEWASLHVALACAWTEGQPYRFLLLDDGDIAGFNPDNLKLTLQMIAKAVADGRLTQAVVAWSRPGEIPDEGWSVVSL